MRYSIDRKRKRKLKHRWGPQIHENNRGKKRNKCKKASLEIHNKLKEFQATTTLGLDS